MPESGVSQILQLKDGVIVALTTSGSVACKTNYSDAWDFKKIESSGVKSISQLEDGVIVAVTTDGRVACKDNYSSAWDFNKITSSGVTQLIGLNVTINEKYEEDNGRTIGVY